MDDQQFTNAATRRITALFHRDANQGFIEDTEKGGAQKRNFSSKNRSKELKRLANSMDVTVPKLKELLTAQRPKMNNGEEKAQYVDWMLGNDSSIGQKRPRKNSDIKSDASPSITASSTVSKKKKPVRPQRQTNSASQEEKKEDLDMPDAFPSSTIHDTSLLSNVKFQDVDAIHPNTKKAIRQVLKLESMTEIQSKTFATAVSGTDVLGRARTGTGKTMAFLLPALERLLASKNYQPGKHVGVLVISPTRELAIQIGTQAEKLVTFHKDLSCQVMYGGTNKNRDTNVLNKQLPSILIATPGRLLDHMENTRLNSGRKFGYDVMRDTEILVLDETDRLLDMGFRNEIRKIMTFLPKQEKRQTLLFSATVPQELKKIMADNMKSDYVEVDCIGDTQDGGHTNIMVEQTYTILPSLESQVTAVVQLVKNSMSKDPDHKIVVFFPTARMVGYFAEFFNLGLKMDVIELHSKKSQGYRNKASDKFRKAKRAILFTSDVSARGVDYPDVTSVIQFGIPESREQYIHRLGRTGRAGKKGEGIIVLAPYEAKFVKELTNIEITLNEEASEIIRSPLNERDSNSINTVLSRIRSGDAKLSLCAEQCYQSFLGYYRGHMKRTTIRTKDELVDTANTLAQVMGLKEQPGLTKKAVGKMGLKGIKNIRIISEADLKNKKRF